MGEKNEARWRTRKKKSVAQECRTKGDPKAQVRGFFLQSIPESILNPSRIPYLSLCRHWSALFGVCFMTCHSRSTMIRKGRKGTKNTEPSSSTRPRAWDRIYLEYFEYSDPPNTQQNRARRRLRCSVSVLAAGRDLALRWLPGRRV